MAKRPRPIFVAEAFAVFGILTLYIAEFLGVPTISTFFEDDTSTLTILSFQAGNDLIEVPQITVILAIITSVILIAYFGFFRKRMFRKNGK